MSDARLPDDPQTPPPGVAIGVVGGVVGGGAGQDRRRGPDLSTLAVALGLVALAVVLVVDAARLPAARGYAGMGPADTPRVIAAALAALGLWAGWDAWHAPEAPSPAQDVPALLWIVGGLGLQLVLIAPTGFSVAGGILFACVAAAFGRRRLWVTVPIGLAVALAIYAVFALLLRLSLPAGPLERLVFGA